MDIEKKLQIIKRKQVFETGNEKQFIRAKDVVWLMKTIEDQQQEIERQRGRANKNKEELELMDNQLFSQQKQIERYEKTLKEIARFGVITCSTAAKKALKTQ